jgi:hypothetical protein
MRNVGFAIVLVGMLGVAAQADVTTTIFSAADTGIRDATNTYGSDPYMYIYGSPYHMGYVRFDLAPLSIYTVLNARLVMTVSGGAPRNDSLVTGRYAVHGLTNMAGNTSQNWDEATLNRSNTGLEVEWTGQTLDIAGGRVINLDADDGVGTTETIVNGPGGSYAPGTTLTLVDTAGGAKPLANFLQSRVDDNGLVTFIIRQDAAGSRGYGLATKENTTAAYWPSLEITYIPGGAVEPQPEDGSTITNLNLSQICWKNYLSDYAVVWFGQADANELNYESRLTLLATIENPAAETCLNIPAEMVPLDVPSTYTWAVESWKYPVSDPNHAGEPNELMNIKIWKFYTSAIPIVKTSPTDQYKFPGETAVFSATFEALTEMTGVVWKQNGQPLNYSDPDINVTLTSMGGNLYSTTLTISHVSAADDGAYTCMGQNAGGDSEPTDPGYLAVKRKLAQWNFNGNVADETNTYNGTLYGEPNYVIDGTRHALEFDGVSDYVDLPDGFENFRAGLTFTVWAKPVTVTSWARFLDLGNGPASDNIFLSRNGTTNNLSFSFYAGTVSAGTVTATNALVLNEWQMFAATMDEVGNVVLYKNGFPIQTGNIPQKINYVARTSNLIGDSNWTADALYTGSLDEVRVYNYALDADTLATIYTEIAGSYCRTQPAMDWSGNCVVDLADLADFTAAWLECGLWPQSACGL